METFNCFLLVWLVESFRVVLGENSFDWFSCSSRSKPCWLTSVGNFCCHFDKPLKNWSGIAPAGAKSANYYAQESFNIGNRFETCPHWTICHFEINQLNHMLRSLCI